VDAVARFHKDIDSLGTTKVVVTNSAALLVCHKMWGVTISLDDLHYTMTMNDMELHVPLFVYHGQCGGSATLSDRLGMLYIVVMLYIVC
jgi:hypothetical protein